MPEIRRVYRARGAALEVFRRREPEVLLAGPAGTGKSRACLEKLHAMCLKNPGMAALIVRKTHVSLTSTGLVTFKRHVIAEAELTGLVRWYGGSSEKPAGYVYSNGSFVAVGGMDKPMKIMSSEYDLVYVQEATELTIEDWESITTRLRNGKVSFQQLLADCNPQYPTHWLKKRCDDGKTVMLHAKHTDNPILFDEAGNVTVNGAAYIAKLDNLSGARKMRLRHGQWVAAEGMIYEGFDASIHVVPHRAIPEAWPRYWSIDFGYTNPFVLQCWAVDPDGRLWLYREIYRSKRLVEDHAKQIIKLVTRADGQWKEPKPRSVICDHDAEDRATFERHAGLGTTAAHKSVSDGIQAVQARFKVTGDGKPRIFILSDALVERDEDLGEAGKPTCTLDEIPGYVWTIGIDGKPVKEDPVKVDDHGCDAKRYMVAELDLAARPRVRVMGQRSRVI